MLKTIVATQLCGETKNQENVVVVIICWHVTKLVSRQSKPATLLVFSIPLPYMKFH
jgi:hypothetical protein